MRKIWLVIQREYLTRVKKKSFIFTTLLLPVGFGLFFILMILLTQYSEGKKVVAVLDESGYFINKLPDKSDKTLYFKFVNSPLDSLQKTYSQAYDGILYIPAGLNPENPRGIMYISENQLGIKDKEYIESLLEKRLSELLMARFGISQELLDKLDVDVGIQTRLIGETEETKSGNTLLATAIGYILGFTIYIMLFAYGTMLMKGVMEEKTNRIIEIITSSIRPFQLMMGKVIGIGAVGLTQFLLWGILILAVNFVITLAFGDQLYQVNQYNMNQDVDPDQIVTLINTIQDFNFTPVIIGFLFYFLSGYLLYGAMFAAIGAATGDDSDSQALTLPVSLPIIASIFIMMTIIYQPDSQLAVWSSIVPLSSPIVMPARIPFGVPAWQIAVSAISLIAGFLITIWLAGKIYRTGILLYGKKVNLKELLRWAIKS